MRLENHISLHGSLGTSPSGLEENTETTGTTTEWADAMTGTQLISAVQK